MRASTCVLLVVLFAGVTANDLLNDLPFSWLPLEKQQINLCGIVSVSGATFTTVPFKKACTLDVEKILSKAVAKPSKPAPGRKVAMPVAEPEVEPALQQVNSAVQPLVQPAAQPAPQPVAQPAAQPVVQPAAQPVAQPAAEPVAQPAAQPAAEPVAQPAAQPVAQPVVQPVIRQIPANPGDLLVVVEDGIVSVGGVETESVVVQHITHEQALGYAMPAVTVMTPPDNQGNRKFML